MKVGAINLGLDFDRRLGGEAFYRRPFQCEQRRDIEKKL